MFKVIVLLLLSPLVVADDNCPFLQGVAIIGVAADAKTKTFLYCEYHFFENKQRIAIDSVGSMSSMNSLDDIVFSEVEYRDTKQQLIAKKSADFSKNRLSPTIEQVDFRHNEKVFIRQEVGESDSGSEGQQVTLDVRYHEPSSGAVNQQIINLNSNTVVDAGFDNAIRVYWDDILSKKKVILDFVAPVQQTSLGLSVKKQSLTRCQKISSAVYTEEEHLCIKVKAANVILSWLVKPIYLVYARSSQRLLTFSGHVNITDGKGKGQTATITYQYQ
jgi:hypothetical protein